MSRGAPVSPGGATESSPQCELWDQEACNPSPGGATERGSTQLCHPSGAWVEGMLTTRLTPWATLCRPSGADGWFEPRKHESTKYTKRKDEIHETQLSRRLDRWSAVQPINGQILRTMPNKALAAWVLPRSG